ncbi:MAG TPA: IPTL-CTERM sorting domain-containing protein [Candidatus Saccharimonadia bacterium]|nr:IPTL-CTERM sorting domain-containing protein [Candidatus Saccharimonadia bacterium]
MIRPGNRHATALSLMFAICVLPAAAPAQAALILSSPGETSGAGLGAVNTILTFGDTPIESGCVGRGASVDVIGPAACRGGNVGGDESTGDSTQTRSLLQLGVTSPDNLRVVFNANESNSGPISLDNLVLSIYSDTGTLLFSSGPFTPIFFAATASGTGTSGYVFRLDAADAAAAAPFFANPLNRIGLSATATQADAGAETLYIADVAVLGAPIIDLAVSKTDSADPAFVGAPLTYTVSATNNGPNTANNVVLTDTLPAGVTFVSATPSQGTCTRSGSVVTCTVGTVLIQRTVTVQIVVTPTVTGSINNCASATATETDSAAANNTACQATLIVPLPVATSVPTLSTWALALLTTAMLALAALNRRRRSARVR